MFGKLIFLIMFNAVHSYFVNIYEYNNCLWSFKNNSVQFARSVFTMEHKSEKIYFSPCRNLTTTICNSKDAIVCVKRPAAVIEFSSEVIQINSTYFRVHSRSPCYDLPKKPPYIVNIFISADSQKMLVQKDICSYELQVPNWNVETPCSESVNNKSLHFDDLSKDIDFELDGNNHAVLNLCGPSERCNDGQSSVCLLQPNKTVHSSFSIGHFAKRSVLYTPGDGVTFRFKTGVGNKGKITTIALKCNWTTLRGDVASRSVSSKTTKISIDTHVGCIKFPHECKKTFLDGYLYDISALNNPDGWNITNHNSNILINICGPLKSSGKCLDQYSQVCHYKDDGTTENLGSLMSSLQMEDDVLKASFKHGSTCEKRNDKSTEVGAFTTMISFSCSFDEKGPKLMNASDCVYDIKWETPEACPKKNSQVHTTITKSCQVADHDKIFDLSPLSHDDRVVKNDDDTEFVLNVCRSLKSSNKCSNNGMCLKNNSMPNIKYRFKSIGKVQSPQIENGRLTLRYNSGSICKKSQEFSAVIYFNCSEKEYGPVLLGENSCAYEFSWATPHACPRQLENVDLESRCILENYSGYRVDFTGTKKHLIEINPFNRNVYTVDICKTNYTVSSNGSSRIIETNRSVDHRENVTFIEYPTEETCDDGLKTNYTIKIFLKCDPYEHNEHFGEHNVSNCAINIEYKHKNVCKDVNFAPSNYNKPVNLHPYEVGNCIYKVNNDTEIVLNKLGPIDLLSSSNKKYTVGINKSSDTCFEFICSGSVQLASIRKCPEPVKADEGLLKLIFNSTVGVSELIFVCKENLELPRISFEGLSKISILYPLDSICYKSHKTYYIVGIVIFIIIIFVCGFVLLYYKRSNREMRRYVYCKNRDD